MLKKKFIETSYNFISCYEKCDDLQTKKLKYGLEAVYNLITKLVVMLLLSILLGIWKEYILLVIVYASARRYAYGLHAKKSITCWCTTLPIYLLGCYFIKYMAIPSYLMYILWSIGFLSFFLWAPADTPARPLIHSETRKKQKAKACMVCVVYLTLILTIQNQVLSNALVYCLIIQSICINPITYKLTNTPFNNYKVYYEKHGLNC